MSLGSYYRIGASLDADVVSSAGSDAVTPNKLNAKSLADTLARATTNSNFVGVTISKDGTQSAKTFDSRDALDTWYGKIADDEMEKARTNGTGAWGVWYVAEYDKTDSAWPNSVNDFGESVSVIVVPGKAPMATPAIATKVIAQPEKKAPGIGTALGALVTAIGLLALASKH